MSDDEGVKNDDNTTTVETGATVLTPDPTPVHVDSYSKGIEYLLAQQNNAILQQQQIFLTNLQNILVNNNNNNNNNHNNIQHSTPGSSGPFRQGTNGMSQKANDKRQKVGDKRPLPTDKEEREDDTLSLTAGTDFDVTIEDEDDPLTQYSNKDNKKGDADGSEEDQDESRYRDLLSTVEEDLGPPIETQFSEVCQKVWGKVKPSEKQKAEFKSILIPKNCTFMKTPWLNPEIYSKISDSAVNKDKGAQRKQRQTTKAAIPLMKALVTLKEVETEVKKKVSPDIFEKIKSVSPQLRQSFRVLNSSFTDILKKRKYDVCSVLGKRFKSFAQSDSSEEYLFDEPAMKKIRAEMKNDNSRQHSSSYSSAAQYQSKNWSSSQKTQRGQHYRGNSSNNSFNRHKPNKKKGI